MPRLWKPISNFLVRHRAWQHLCSSRHFCDADQRGLPQNLARFDQALWSLEASQKHSCTILLHVHHNSDWDTDKGLNPRLFLASFHCLWEGFNETNPHLLIAVPSGKYDAKFPPSNFYPWLFCRAPNSNQAKSLAREPLTLPATQPCAYFSLSIPWQQQSEVPWNWAGAAEVAFLHFVHSSAPHADIWRSQGSKLK